MKWTHVNPDQSPLKVWQTYELLYLYCIPSRLCNQTLIHMNNSIYRTILDLNWRGGDIELFFLCRGDTLLVAMTVSWCVVLMKQQQSIDAVSLWETWLLFTYCQFNLIIHVFLNMVTFCEKYSCQFRFQNDIRSQLSIDSVEWETELRFWHKHSAFGILHILFVISCLI